ncbi:hypothetical protein BLNAU_10206 [Blattamonas nauphoetae]|uniref:Uncharacterized protein n=1 Tax=Blattamonas nauphoetae TaxID=2049346 RepID=A0ABQ9XTR8_9EUKA|nr:hypothetical protein BLNAU_10206 [Blattamonas nauphoetae]
MDDLSPLSHKETSFFVVFNPFPDEGSAIALLRVAALTISSVEFSVNSALATHLFVVNGGSLTLESSVSVGSTVNSLSCASQNVMSVLVHKCEFNDCNVISADAAAGAVYAELRASMTVTETNFTLCTSNCSTGAMHIHMISTTAVSNCEFVESQVLLTIFQNCSAGNNGGGFYQTFNPSTTPGYTPAFTFSLENCTFDNCTAGGAGGGCLVSDQTTGFPTVAVTLPEVIAVNCKAKQGAVILARDMKSVSIEKSSFTSCESSDSGTIRVNHLVSSSIKTSNFTDCVTMGEEGGGGIVIDTEDSRSGGGVTFVLTAESVALNLEMGSVAFGTVAEGSENTCEGLGNDVFVEFRSIVNNTFLQRISTALFPSSPADGIAFTRSQRLSAAFAENTTVYTARCSVLVHFNHSSNGALTIDSENGLDEERCGESTVPCETLTREVGGIAAGQTLRIRATASLAQIVTISKEMTWTHAEATTGSVSVKTGGSISVASRQLNLVKIEFSSEATVKLTTSLLVVSSGSLSVTSCSFTKISSSADGSSISASLSTNSLSIADAAFKTCSSDGSGGAVCDHLGVVLKLCLLFDWAWQMGYEATTVEMGSSGRDLAGCGLSQWRCKEFDVSSTHLAGVGLHTISVVDSFSLNEPPSFSTNEITVSSPLSTTKISVSSAATISISGHTLTLSSLLFDGLSQERSTALTSLAATGG